MQVLPYYFLFHYITEQKSKESGTIPNSLPIFFITPSDFFGSSQARGWSAVIHKDDA